MGENEREIDFVLIKKKHPRLIRNVKTILGEFQHALLTANIDKRKIRKVVRWTFAERRRVGLMKDAKIRMRFEEKVM